MARLNTRASTTDSLYRDRTPVGNGAMSSASTPPTPSFSSDKENRGSSRTTSGTKRALGEVSTTMVNGGKRRRLAEQGRREQSEETEQEPDEPENDDKNYYDPEQDPEERRHVRMAMRENARELQDRADEFLNNGGTGLVNLIQRQNSLMKKVKQTSDATMDSRFLLNASEITLKKSRLLAFGDSALGIDMDEFVSKCITFMRYGRAFGADDDEDEEATSTQARQRRRHRHGDEDSDDENDGDVMNWAVLGERACFPNNNRPAVPSFLLGPLSVEKKVRATQRRATQRREQPAAATRPQEMKEADLERNQASNLTNQCIMIRELLTTVSKAGVQNVQAEADEDMDQEEAEEIFSRNNLAMNWEVPLLKFVINPDSFGQTVENLFYVSFLIKDGYVQVNIDEDTGFPTLRPRDNDEISDPTKTQKDKNHQAIFSLDYATWQIFKDTMQIKKPLIPHREEEAAAVNGRGWYG